MLCTGSCASIIGSHEKLRTHCILFVPCLHAIAMGLLMQYMYLYEVCVCVHTHIHTQLTMCLSNWGWHNIDMLLHILVQSFISSFFIHTPIRALISSVWCCHMFGNVIYSMLNHFWPELIPDREHTVWSLTFLLPQGQPHSKHTTWCSGYHGKQVVTHSQKGY